MLVNPRTVIDNGWVRFPSNVDVEKFIQPNALDFTIDSLYTVAENVFKITADDQKQHRGVSSVPLTDGHWTLYRGVYDMASEMYVEVPEGHAAQLVTRSSFVRNGLYILSGLYDSGFKGPIGCVLHNRCGEAWIEPGTRIGQIIFVDSQTAKQYAGGYSTNEGEHWTTKQ